MFLFILTGYHKVGYKLLHISFTIIYYWLPGTTLVAMIKGMLILGHIVEYWTNRIHRRRKGFDRASGRVRSGWRMF